MLWVWSIDYSSLFSTVLDLNHWMILNWSLLFYHVYFIFQRLHRRLEWLCFWARSVQKLMLITKKWFVIPSNILDTMILPKVSKPFFPNTTAPSDYLYIIIIQKYYSGFLPNKNSLKSFLLGVFVLERDIFMILYSWVTNHQFKIKLVTLLQFKDRYYITWHLSDCNSSLNG